MNLDQAAKIVVRNITSESGRGVLIHVPEITYKTAALLTDW